MLFRSLKVAILDYPQFSTLDDNGNACGYAIDYLEEISKYTGWNYEYIPMTIEESIEACANGIIDIIPGCTKTKIREEYILFPQEQMGDGGTMLSVLPETNHYYYNDYENYDGMIVGVLKGSARIQHLEDLCDQYDISMTLKYYATDKDAKEALNQKEVDALLLSTSRCDKNMKIIARLNSTPLYYGEIGRAHV